MIGVQVLPVQESVHARQVLAGSETLDIIPHVEMFFEFVGEQPVIHDAAPGRTGFPSAASARSKSAR